MQHQWPRPQAPLQMSQAILHLHHLMQHPIPPRQPRNKLQLPLWWLVSINEKQREMVLPLLWQHLRMLTREGYPPYRCLDLSEAEVYSNSEYIRKWPSPTTPRCPPATFSHKIYIYSTRWHKKLLCLCGTGQRERRWARTKSALFTEYFGRSMHFQKFRVAQLHQGSIIECPRSLLLAGWEGNWE